MVNLKVMKSYVLVLVIIYCWRISLVSPFNNVIVPSNGVHEMSLEMDNDILTQSCYV